MLRSAPVDGFQLAYERQGAGPSVILLHGWPGDREDFRAVTPLLRDRADVLVPDLRGFGESDKHPDDPAVAYAADAQARSVLGLMDELDVRVAVLAGYDIGSRIAQTMARTAPERVAALVVCPPLPGVGARVLDATAQREFWYQAFHQLDLAEQLIDGNPEATRAYLRHFWSHWSGPDYAQPESELDRLVKVYQAPGAFTASISWYRAGSGLVARSLAEVAPEPRDRLSVATRVVWPEHDPVLPQAWGDRLDEFFSDVTMRRLPGVGHFVPVEAPQAFAAAVLDALDEVAMRTERAG